MTQRQENADLSLITEELRHLHERIATLEAALRQLQNEVRGMYEEEVYEQAP